MMKRKLRSFRNYDDLKERRMRLDQDIADMENDLGAMQQHLTGNLLSFGWLGKAVSSKLAVPVKAGSGALVATMASRVQNPVIRAAVPVIAGVVADRVTDKQVQANFLNKIKQAVQWLEQKTTLTAVEEAYLLDAEAAAALDAGNTGGFNTARVLESEFKEAEGKKLEVQINSADWY